MFVSMRTNESSPSQPSPDNLPRSPPPSSPMLQRLGRAKVTVPTEPGLHQNRFSPPKGASWVFRRKLTKKQKGARLRRAQANRARVHENVFKKGRKRTQQYCRRHPRRRCCCGGYGKNCGCCKVPVMFRGENRLPDSSPRVPGLQSVVDSSSSFQNFATCVNQRTAA